MKFDAVVNEWNTVVASAGMNKKRDKSAAEALFRRKLQEAERQLDAARASRAAAAGSLNLIGAAAAQAGVMAAQLGVGSVKARIEFARFRLDRRMGQVDDQAKEMSNWLKAEMEKGHKTQEVFTKKKGDWAQISTMASSLQNEVKAKGEPASWMSTEASSNYSDAVRPQIAALQDLSIAAGHSSKASEAVVEVQRAMYEGLSNAFKGVNAAVNSFNPAAYGTDEYGRAVNSTLAQLREVNNWKAGFLGKFERPINQISSIFKASVTAAGNLTPDWPRRSQHHVNESEIGDLFNEINLAAAENSKVAKVSDSGMQF